MQTLASAYTHITAPLYWVQHILKYPLRAKNHVLLGTMLPLNYSADKRSGCDGHVLQDSD